MKTSIRGSSQRNYNESLDCIIAFDETCSDPLKKRLDASSSLLASFTDSGVNSLKYGYFCYHNIALSILLLLVWHYE